MNNFLKKISVIGAVVISFTSVSYSHDHDHDYDHEQPMNSGSRSSTVALDSVPYILGGTALVGSIYAAKTAISFANGTLGIPLKSMALLGFTRSWQIGLAAAVVGAIPGAFMVWYGTYFYHKVPAEDFQSKQIVRKIYDESITSAVYLFIGTAIVGMIVGGTSGVVEGLMRNRK